MTPPKQPVSVLVVIYTAALDVLLLERAAHPGFWQSVTGSREGDEILIDTARREVLEETGIDTASGVLSDWRITNTFEIFSEWRHRYAPGITHNDEHVFSLKLPQRQEIRTAQDEHRDCVWVPWLEAAQRCFSWSNRDAILMLPQRRHSGT
ncbi:MAG: dihydroneopterin triphosphate diphosphatase [Betaproteobacteria bacterium]|nr:dihydroneopterin triphosphate diphosphatase [Betaproteobacteria bacterium]